jgi:hypothetical protein
VNGNEYRQELISEWHIKKPILESAGQQAQSLPNVERRATLAEGCVSFGLLRQMVGGDLLLFEPREFNCAS